MYNNTHDICNGTTKIILIQPTKGYKGNARNLLRDTQCLNMTTQSTSMYHYYFVQFQQTSLRSSKLL